MQPCFTTSRWWTFTSGLFLALLLAACADPAPEYQTMPGGSHWKLLAFDEREMGLDSAAMVQANVKVYMPGDSTLSLPGKTFSRSDDDLWRAFSGLFVGDSIVFHSVSSDFLRTSGFRDDTLTYHVRIVRMRTQRQLDDARLVELGRLDSLVKSDSLREGYSEHGGIWLRRLSPGDTSVVREGREVVLHYQGRTLDGRVFDDSRMQDGPLRFVMGQEHQVIQGIEIGLRQLHRGEIAELIVPSWMAFGGKGSVGGVVPPYTTVVYRVEVLELSVE